MTAAEKAKHDLVETAREIFGDAEARVVARRVGLYAGPNAQLLAALAKVKQPNSG